MRIGHAQADVLHEREHDEGGDGVADERCDAEDQDGEGEEDGIEAHAGDAGGDALGDRVQQAGAGDGVAEGEAAGGEDDDCPEEVVEVLLCQDARPEKQDERDDGQHAHVPKHRLQPVRKTPERNRAERDGDDEPLRGRVAFPNRPDRHDDGAPAGPQPYHELEPDGEDGENAHRHRNEEPDAPAGNGRHVLQRDQVLW